MIIDEKLIKEAIALARPSIVAILNKKGATWGPKWVAGYVKAPGMDKLIDFEFTSYRKFKPWKAKWGKKEDFYNIARKKLEASDREKMSTRSIVAFRPQCLKKGEFLYPGGVNRYGVSVGISGARGSADEGIAEILRSTIGMLAHLKTDARIKKDQMEI